MNIKGSVREKLIISVYPLFDITKFVWFMLKASFLVIGKISIKKKLIYFNALVSFLTNSDSTFTI